MADNVTPATEATRGTEDVATLEKRVKDNQAMATMKAQEAADLRRQLEIANGERDALKRSQREQAQKEAETGQVDYGKAMLALNQKFANGDISEADFAEGFKQINQASAEAVAKRVFQEKELERKAQEFRKADPGFDEARMNGTLDKIIENDPYLGPGSYFAAYQMLRRQQAEQRLAELQAQAEQALAAAQADGIKAGQQVIKEVIKSSEATGQVISTPGQRPPTDLREQPDNSPEAIKEEGLKYIQRLREEGKLRD